VYVANTRVTDAGIRNLQQSLPRARIIRQPQ
jgi:hypothetical protein